MCRSTILCPFLYEREEKNAFPKLSNVIFFPVIVSGQDFIDFSVGVITWDMETSWFMKSMIEARNLLISASV